MQGLLEPQLFGVKLRFSRSVKYLGVILDSRLTWREYLEVKVRKAQNLLWACRRACGMGWGSKAQGEPLVRPTISFASLVWWPGCLTASTKSKLSKVQRLACLGITGVFQTTPTSAMEVLVGLPPLDLVIQGEASSTAHRLWVRGVGLTFTPTRAFTHIDSASRVRSHF